MRREKILIWKRPSTASFHLPPPLIFLLLVTIFAQMLRMMESQTIESKPASDLCGNILPCCSFLGPADFRVKEDMLRSEMYVIQLLPSPALTDK